MADEEAEQDRGTDSDTFGTIGALKQRLQELAIELNESSDSPVQSSSQYCHEFCQTLLEYAGRWKIEEDPLPLVGVYTVALQSFAVASCRLSSQCEHVPLVLERLSLSFVELLLSLKDDVPDALWREFRSAVQSAHSRLQENDITQLPLLPALAQGSGVWSNRVLHSLLSNEHPQMEQVYEFFTLEGPVLLEMRVKQLIKQNYMEKAALLAKACAAHPAFDGKGHFKQMHLLCLCSFSEQEALLEELSTVDCRDALEMICNLESEGDEQGAFTLCSAFLTRQLLQEDTYCAWELTLCWSKLLKRLESTEQGFLDRCRQMSSLSKTVFHILFFIKVIQSEVDSIGLPLCIEMCIKALQMESSDGNTKATICKTISCLLPSDLEVKRACQLTEFLLEPTVDSYYAVETLYNEPDQKLEEENMPVPNSLRCELLLVFKTQWPFDPEFWDWKTLKRQCLGLMGEEASIVSSIDLLNDSESPEGPEPDTPDQEEFKDVTDCFVNTTNELKEITDKRQKNREIKKLREKGFISARFRNWQAYMQYCVLCDKEFLGHRIVRHAQTHFRDGLYSCPICAETFTSKETLVPHVASHVKQSCKERLTAMKASKKLANPKTAAPVIAALKAKTENQLHTRESSDYFEPNGDFRESIRTKVSGFKLEKGEENICPVANCRKGFKFLKNLLAHVKAHGDNEEAKRFLDMQNSKVVCQYCRRQFVNVTHLNDHLQVHCGVKPYICIQLNCRASFLSNTELIVHKKEHPVFKARCMFPNCGKIFNDAYKLYDHEAQHYNTFTCKVPDCGKVFHSQTQLDLHQEEHNDTKQVDSPAPEENTCQDAEVPPSLIERMLSDQTTFSQVTAQDSQDCIDENALQPEPVRATHSIESLQPSAQVPVQNLHSLEQYPVKSEPDMFPIKQCFSNSVIQSMGSHFADPTQLSNPSTGSDVQSFNYFSQTPHNQLIPPFESAIGEFPQAQHTNVMQGQAQIFQNNGNVGSMRYNSECSVQLPGQLQAMCVNNLLPAGPPQDNMPLAMSQPLPPALALLPPTGTRPENITSYPSTSALPPTVEKERHHCAFETCTRNYSSYRSVTKHMKAVHPEFYNQWKLAKRNNKASRTAPLSVPFTGNCKPVALIQEQQGNGGLLHGGQKQNVIQPSPYINMGPGPSYPSLPSHSSSVQCQNDPIHMENILNPIVLSQLGSTPNSLTAVQPQIAPSQQWQSRPGHEQIRNCGPTRVYPSNMQGLPQMETTTGALALGTPSHHMLGSNMGNTAESLRTTPLENGSQPVLPPYMASVKALTSQTGNVLPPYTSQIQGGQSSSVSISSSQEMTNTVQNHVQSNCPSSNGICQANTNQPPQHNSVITENSIEKRVKRNKRTKWPAIIRDGKFICCRCFRAFDSSKSLGGHLSKRSHCKAYDEAELSAALPTSFLDLLNSEQTANILQPPLSYNPHSVYQDKLCKPDTSGSTDPKDFLTSNYPQTNLPAYGNVDSNDDLLKQIMASSNISELFEPPVVPQPTFQNSCGSYRAHERLPESSVIQHTGNIQVKRENESYTSHYPQASVMAFGTRDFSDPLLSQLLSENLPVGPPDKLPTDQVKSRDLQNEGHLSTMENLVTNYTSNPLKQSLSPDAHHSPASTSGKQADVQRKGVEQDIKKRLREQILAGDFQRRNSLSHSGNFDSNSSLKSPMSLSPTPSISKLPGLHQMAQYPTNTDTTRGIHIQETNSTLTPTFSDQNQEVFSMQNLTEFAEMSTKKQEQPIPTSMMEKDVGLAPTMSSADQHVMNEIETAFENLNLDREIPDQALTSIKPVSNDIHCENEPAKTDPLDPTFVKPFACESENCTFRSMSNESLVKHLIKSHNYTLEMLHSLRKRQGKIAPFSCQKCSKTFTRNSNLRIHYHSTHKLSQEEIADLDMKRKLARTIGCVTQNQVTSGSTTHVAQTGAIASHLPVATSKHPYSQQDQIKQEYPLSPFRQNHNTDVMNRMSHGDNFSMEIKPQQRMQMHNPALNQTPKISEVQIMAPSSAVATQPIQAGHDADHWSDGQHIPPATVSTQYQPSEHAGDRVSSVATPVIQALPGPHQANASLSPENQSIINKHKMLKPKFEKPNMDMAKKMKEKKPESNDAFSPYRPYRCVHQGCVAAFTIQHNLILHYRAVHQSALSDLEVSQEQYQSEDIDDANALEDDEAENEVMSEFRCQEKDCSRVFLEVPSLLQHYLHLHEFSLDKAGALMSGINLGRFSCDQQGCTASFTAFWKYIAHVEEEHGNVRLYRIESANEMFKCDIEGCDRAYATKSNLLRHTMKKHYDNYQLKQMNQHMSDDGMKQNSKNSHYQINKLSNGKENIESNKKIQQSDKCKTERVHANHWTKYGKPSLKSKEEATAMCTKRYTLQYPCMIKSCETVMRSERSIMKHYIGHGLSEKYLEVQRSYFIFCKKLSRQKSRSFHSDDSRSESDLSDTEYIADTGLEGTQYEYSKPVLRKRDTSGDTGLFDSKLSNDESSETLSDSSVVVKRKRGRPRKFLEKMVKRKRIPRTTRNKVVYHGDDGSDSSSSPTRTQDELNVPLNSFKPMGFEMSFLKFLEQSNESEQSMNRNVKLSTMSSNSSDAYLHAKESCVEFSNPQKLKSLNNVKIIVDGAYSDVSDLLLKQLQEMRPMVILEK